MIGGNILLLHTSTRDSDGHDLPSRGQNGENAEGLLSILKLTWRECYIFLIYNM